MTMSTSSFSPNSSTCRGPAAEDAQRMRLVHIDERPEFLGHLDLRSQVGNVARHAENPVHHHELSRVRRQPLQPVPERNRRVMPVGDKLCRRN